MIRWAVVAIAYAYVLLSYSFPNNAGSEQYRRLWDGWLAPILKHDMIHYVIFVCALLVVWIYPLVFCRRLQDLIRLAILAVIVLALCYAIDQRVYVLTGRNTAELQDSPITYASVAGLCFSPGFVGWIWLSLASLMGWQGLGPWRRTESAGHL